MTREMEILKKRKRLKIPENTQLERFVRASSRNLAENLGFLKIFEDTGMSTTGIIVALKTIPFLGHVCVSLLTLVYASARPAV